MQKTTNTTTIENMLKAGAHFGMTRSRRHPTVTPYIFGTKNKTELFDLEKTEPLLAAAKEFIKTISKTGKQILFVGGKSEAKKVIQDGAMSVAMPYVAGRWIGGTLTNFVQIKKRMEKLEKLTTEREKGELVKYTKKERLLIDREIAKLEVMFSGIMSMKEMPVALFIIDPKREINAVREAQQMNIPIIALLGSDNDFTEVKYPIVGNDASKNSIQFFTKEITAAYEEGRKA
jgi:small subunit ribosomal protein S2